MGLDGFLASRLTVSGEKVSENYDLPWPFPNFRIDY